jgi:hypothetical protein
MNRKKAKLVKQVEEKKSSPFIIFLSIAFSGLAFHDFIALPVVAVVVFIFVIVVLCLRC